MTKIFNNWLPLVVESTVAMIAPLSAAYYYYKIAVAMVGVYAAVHYYYMKPQEDNEASLEEHENQASSSSADMEEEGELQEISPTLPTPHGSSDIPMHRQTLFMDDNEKMRKEEERRQETKQMVISIEDVDLPEEKMKDSKGNPFPTQRVLGQECPLCMCTFPLDQSEIAGMFCCGNHICAGCKHVSLMKMGDRGRKCPYCRQIPPDANNEKMLIKRLQERIESHKDPDAMYALSSFYRDGNYGILKNAKKQVELLRMAAILEHPASLFHLGLYHTKGYPDGNITKNLAKAKESYEIAAYRGGYCGAWQNLGYLYYQEGRNISASMYHFRMASSYGDCHSLNVVKWGYKNGHISKEDFETTLRAWQAANDEMATDDRKKAKARKKAAKASRNMRAKQCQTITQQN